MTEITNTAQFMAMKGAGYYSRSTKGAKDVIDRALPLVLNTLENLPIPQQSRPWRVADFGAADGGTSLDLWRAALALLRKRAPTLAIEMVYTDLPRNDFSQLFRHVLGQTDLKSYIGEIADVYPYASATGFHDRIFPDGALDFGFSAHAGHYISRTPCNLSSHVHMAGAQGVERAAYEEQGRLDWERFLLARTRELAPGGRLVLSNFCIDESGRYLGATGGANMFDTFARLWRSLVDDHILKEREFSSTNFPQCYRTLAQFAAPFEGPNGRAREAGLVLASIESRVVACPYKADFVRHGDASAFAHAYLPTLRSWSEAVFAQGLDVSRSPQEKEAIVDELYRRFYDDVIAAPQAHGMDYVIADLICVKQS